MIKKQTPWFVLHSPEFGKAFERFYSICEDDGVLDKKTKELIMLAISSVFRSPSCTEEHLNRASEAGATKEEITEALLIAAAESTWTQLVLEKQIYLKYLGANNHK